MDGKLFSDHIDLSSKECYECDFLMISSLYKEELKDQELEQEYLRSYLRAAKDLQAINYRRSHPNNMPAMLIRKDQICIPFLFLCKHTLELAMKYKLKTIGAGYPAKHSLEKLWAQLKSHLEIDNAQYEELIKGLDKLDENYALRYSESKSGDKNKGEVITIHTQRIMATTEELFNLLIGGKD